VIDVQYAMALLAARRPIFHSEADFQFQFAWVLHLMRPDADVRLEYPIGGTQRGAIDVVVLDGTGREAFELKYLCRKLSVSDKGEQFLLRAQGAQDLRRYDVCKDIQRIEQFARQTCCRGAVLVVSNDSSFWRPRRTTGMANDSAFCLADDRVLAGELAWKNPMAGSAKNREKALNLSARYRLRWQHYSRGGEFRYLHVKVPPAVEATNEPFTSPGPVKERS